MNSPRSLPVLFSLLFVASAHAAITITPTDSAPLMFAAAEVQRAAKASGSSAPDLTLRVEPGVPQAYRIERDGVAVRTGYRPTRDDHQKMRRTQPGFQTPVTPSAFVD